MKKKVLAMILAASMIFSLCACSKEQPTQGETKKETPTEVEEIEENGDDTENSGKADATSNNGSPSVGEISVEDSGNVSDNSEFTIHLSVRPAGTKGKNWIDLLEVNVGDEVEYQIL